MYGYVVPFKEKLLLSDFVLYRSFYCGMCKSTGRQFGQFPRFTTNYDMTFFQVFLHDCLTHDVGIEPQGCVCNPFKKKPIAFGALVDKISAVNVILAYYKAEDGVRDKEGAKMRIVRSALKKPFKKAARICPEVAETVKKGYDRLFEMERSGTHGIDRVADCFASLLRDVADIILGESSDEYKRGVSYNIGKLVYLMDALDDIDEDSRKKRYNPLLVEFGDYTSREKFIADHYEDLSFMLNSTCNRAIENFNSIKFSQSLSLMRNILYHGLREKIKELLASKKKLGKPKI